MATIKLKAPSGGSVSLVAGDTVSDVVFTIPPTTSTIVTSDVLAAPTGAGLVGYMPAGVGAVGRTLQDKLRERVSVKDFGAVGDGVVDDTVAIQAAINHAALSGSNKVVYLPSGRYKLSSQGTVEIPAHDDGTGTKPAYNGSTVVSIAAEPIYQQAYCLKIPNASSIVIVGDGQGNTTLVGDYVANASLTYPIAIAISGASHYNWGGIADLGISNFFIGVASLDNNLVECKFSNLLFYGCGISMLTRYLERSIFSKIHFFGCSAGLVGGGFWTTRADNYAEDGGFSDKNTFNDITGQSFYSITSPNFAAVDTYFDTYFFKSVNNTTRKYPVGGSGTPATAQPYKGISGYTLALLSRYYRPNAANIIGRLVHMGSSRPAMQLKCISVLNIDSVYLENVGYANALSSGAVVGDGVYNDPYHSGRYVDLVGNGLGSFGGINILNLEINSGCVAATCQPTNFLGGVYAVRDAGISSVPILANARIYERGITCNTGNLKAPSGHTGGVQHDLIRINPAASPAGIRQYELKYAPSVAFSNHTFSSSLVPGTDETISPAGFVIGDGSCTLRFELSRGTYRHCCGARVINRVIGSGESIASITVLGTDVSTVTGGAVGMTVTVDGATGVLTFACTSSFSSTTRFDLYLVLEGSGLSSV